MGKVKKIICVVGILVMVVVIGLIACLLNKGTPETANTTTTPTSSGMTTTTTTSSPPDQGTPSETPVPDQGSGEVIEMDFQELLDKVEKAQGIQHDPEAKEEVQNLVGKTIRVTGKVGEVSQLRDFGIYECSVFLITKENCDGMLAIFNFGRQLEEASKIQDLERGAPITVEGVFKLSSLGWWVIETEYTITTVYGYCRLENAKLLD